MKLLNLRTAAATSLGAAALAATFVAAPQAQAATTYWQFKALSTGTCLSAGTTGVVFASTCTGATNQQWDFVGNDASGYNQLKNRLTGRCLSTTNHEALNGTTTESCNWVAGQRFHYDYTTEAFTSALTYGGTNLKLRAEGPAVYAGQQLAFWSGWHN